MNFELTKDFVQEVKWAVETNNEQFIIDQIAPLHPADIAEILDEVNLEEAQFIYKHLDEEKAADALIELDEDTRERFLASLSSKEIAEQFIDNLDSDDAADVIAELPEDKKEEVLSHIEDIDQASDIVDLLNYEEGTAGAIMAKELIYVQLDWSIAKCIAEMRKQAEDVDHVYTIYVVDKNNVLVGTMSLKSLLYVEPKSRVKDVYMDKVRSVKADTPVEEVVEIMEKYDLVVLPVVDAIGRLLGRITIDDAVDVMKEEADKDYQMASGISQNVESSDKIWILSKARLPWLLIGLLGGILSSQVIGVFENDIQIYPEMAFFIPLIAATGGNVGVQSSAIIVQGLANNSLGFDGIAQRLGKELGVALLNGIACSLLMLIYNLVVSDSLALCATVSTALLSVIIFAGLFGTLIPLLLNKYKIDPALATGPFITTLNDILGLLLYFQIGRLMYI